MFAIKLQRAGGPRVEWLSERPWEKDIERREQVRVAHMRKYVKSERENRN